MEGAEMPETKARERKRPVCRFFAARNGCRAGDACPFIHDRALLLDGSAGASSVLETTHNEKHSKDSSGPSKGTTRSALQAPILDTNSQEAPQQYIPPTVDRSRVVQKPISRVQADNPREFQIQQLRKRFSPEEAAERDGTAFTFNMAPSDPDFPFEIVGLECVFHVPFSYPKDAKPFLSVKNKEMGRGYQINVERGFDALVAKSPQSTLLGLMNALDRQLESLLTEQKAETVKIVPNARPAGFSQQSEQARTSRAPAPEAKAKPVGASLPSYTDEEKNTAAARRELETRQLEARLGRLPLFFKSSDGVSYILPIEPRKRADLPVPLQAVRTVRLFVPVLYPLQSCRIEIQGVTREAATNTEKGFGDRAQEHSESTLMGHINYLTQNMHVFATEPSKADVTGLPSTADVAALQIEDQTSTQTSSANQGSKQADTLVGRGHVQFIPRPPEWSTPAYADEDDNSDSGSYESGDELDDEDSGVELEAAKEPATGPERGVLLSFPYLELHAIELLELVSLSITIKCERCKDQMDVKTLRNANSIAGDGTGVRTESCKKCASALKIGYRKELMHVNSVKAGYLDLDGCIVVDMLPSNFIPTCSDCSTSYPSPGIVSVRGESTNTVCRECHHKMSFRIPEIKFLLVSAAAVRNNQPPPRKKIRENLGIVAGQELPRRGRCPHYSKSYRWFRFGCCSKVFPCDKCHDDQSDHPNEHANRMICGFCSREQNYRPEDCGVCHSVLVGKAGSGFWEGGKGTRDKVKMNRKDARKYRRRPGTKPRA